MKLILLSMMCATVAAADPKADQQKAREQAIEDARKAGILASKGAQEHYELATLLGPFLTCDGTFIQAGKKLAFDGTMHLDSELEGAWLHESFEGTAGGAKVAFDAHLAFDSKTKQWTRVEVSSSGGYEISHAAPLANGKLEWESDLTIAGGRTLKSKNHLDASDPKLVKVVGEVSLDGGKTFAKLVEMTCKKH